MNYKFIAIPILLCAITHPAFATDKNNNYMILGPGAYSCRKIVDDLTLDAQRNNPASVIVYSNWLAGDLTAYNRGAKDTYSILGKISVTEAFGRVVGYCQSHPDAIYASAVDITIEGLHDGRYRSAPTSAKPVLSEGDSSAAHTEATRRGSPDRAPKTVTPAQSNDDSNDSDDDTLPLH